MESAKVSPVKSALNYGTLLGIIMMILSMIVFIFEWYEATWMTIASYIVLIAGIVYGIKRHRDLERGGIISYGGALGYGTLIGLFVGIIGALMLYIYLGYIDDSFIYFNLEKQEMQFYERGMADEQIEQAMAMSEKFSTPGIYAFAGAFMNTLTAFIISLIAAAFLKKEAEHFDDTV